MSPICHPCHHGINQKGESNNGYYEKTTSRSLLLNKGIILQSGAICQDKINLISGAMTAPLIETIWIFCGYDVRVMERVSTIFTHLYNEGL